MKWLLKNALIVDSKSPYNGKKCDILIENDEIKFISENIVDSDAEQVDINGNCVSPGWFELHSHFSEPGHEEMEDLISGSLAAAAGGFTSVAITAQTTPVLQTKSDIDYIYNRSEELPVNLYPVGALSRNLEGKELADLFDMYQNGAIGFYDAKSAIANPNLLKLALQYTRNFSTPIFSFPFEANLAVSGQMNEGVVSTYLGLKGMPDLSEEIMVLRDLRLAEYAEAHIHITSISTSASIEHIRSAKSKGIHVTCDVNLYNLVSNDEELTGFDTNFKTNPPLRNEANRRALIEAILDGTIDAIAVDHLPLDIEHKLCEFDLASFGMAGLETAFGISSALIEEIGLERFVACITHAPREIFGMGSLIIAEGNIAELTVFNPSTEWIFNKSIQESKAYNHAYSGRKLKGKVSAIFNKGQYIPQN